MWMFPMERWIFPAEAGTIWEFAWMSEILNERWEMSKSHIAARLNLSVCLKERSPIMIWTLAYWRDSAGRHVGAADGLDLLHVAELLVVEQLVEVHDDLVEQADALHLVTVIITMMIIMILAMTTMMMRTITMTMTKAMMHPTPSLTSSE